MGRRIFKAWVVWAAVTGLRLVVRVLELVLLAAPTWLRFHFLEDESVFKCRSGVVTMPSGESNELVENLALFGSSSLRVACQSHGTTLN